MSRTMSKRDIIFFSLMAASSLWWMSLEYFQYRMEKRYATSGTAISKRFRVIGYLGTLALVALAAFVRFWLLKR